MPFVDNSSPDTAFSPICSRHQKFHEALILAPDPVQTVRRRIMALSYISTLGLFHIVFHRAVENPDEFWKESCSPTARAVIETKTSASDARDSVANVLHLTYVVCRDLIQTCQHESKRTVWRSGVFHLNPANCCRRRNSEVFMPPCCIAA